MSGPGDLCPRVSHRSAAADIVRLKPRCATRREATSARFGHRFSSTTEDTAMKGDRVEIVIDAGSGTTRTYDVTATRAGRRVNVTHGRGVVEVSEITRGGTHGAHGALPGQPRARPGRAPGAGRARRRRDHPFLALGLTRTLPTPAPMTSPAAGARPHDRRRVHRPGRRPRVDPARCRDAPAHSRTRSRPAFPPPMPRPSRAAPPPAAPLPTAAPPPPRRNRERRRAAAAVFAPMPRLAARRAASRSHLPRRAARRGSPRRHRRGDPRPPGRDRRRRDRLREDHADSQDLPRPGPRRHRHDRPHPAAAARRAHRRRPDRRGAGHRAGRRRAATRSASPTRSATTRWSS